MSRLKAWWSQPDQYDWVTSFLRQNGMLTSARTIMALVAGSSALVPLTVLPSLSRPSRAEAILGGVAAAFTIGVTAWWLTRWPSRRQSIACAMIGALFVGGWSLVQPNAALAALGCTAMAVPGGYVAFFHGPKLIVFNSVVAAAVTTTAVLRLSHETIIATAASALWINVFINLSVPLAISGMLRAMRTYIQRSENDALTGLLNRQAFTQAVGDRLTDPPSGHTHLAVVMLDLDNFKRINDTHGHSAGDRALQAVAEVLREHSPADAVVCRAGGEEFLVALTAVVPDVVRLAAQFCTELARLSPKMTASIGTATAQLHLITGPDVAGPLDDLIKIADSGMYAAKRCGGNQAHHAIET
jgi:diguanylate cyclase (GGDEF)-like protein